MIKVTRVWFSAAFLFITCLARADLVTSSAQFISPSVIDFSQFADASGLQTTGPVQVGALAGVDVVFTSTNVDGAILGSGPYGLGDNGQWDANQTFAGLNVDASGFDGYTMMFQFNSGPVADVGGIMNYATFAGSGFGDVILSALAADNSTLEAWDLSVLAPILTPNGIDDGAFRGIVRPQADIFGFAVSNSAVAITDLTFSSQVVPTPEPGSLLLLFTALVVSLVHWQRGCTENFSGFQADGGHRRVEDPRPPPSMT